MQNGQLKPGYNVQISTESHYVIHYTLHRTTNDLPTLKPHLNSFEKLYDFLPLDLTADAGYGSEEIQLNQDTCRPVMFIKRNTVRVVH